MEMLFGEPDTIDDVVKELWAVPDWPRDHVKDRALVAELQRQFPDVDLADEMQRFRVWLVGQSDQRKVVKSRGRYQRIRNWVARTGRPGSVASTGRTAGRSRPCRTSARPAAAFGAESSVALERW